MVVVRCSFTIEEDCHFQLASTASLHDHGSQQKSQLLYMEGLGVPGITHYSVKGQVMKFTLYFEPLPVSCRTFSLFATTMDNEKLAAVEIHRYSSDVYKVELEIAPF